MNTAKFSDKQQERFDLLDFQAVYQFSTASTIAFRLEKATVVPNQPYILGWMDLHLVPKSYGVKAYLRTVLPDDYPRSDLQSVISAVFDVLEIPQDVVYEAYFHAPLKQSVLTSDVDRSSLLE